MKRLFVNIYRELIEDMFIIYTLIAIVLKSIIFEGFTLNKNADNFYVAISFFYTLPKLYYYIAFAGLFIAFAFRLKGKVRIWALFLFNLLISILLLVDLWYYRGFGTMTSVHLLSQTSNLDNLSGSVISFIKFNDCIFIIDLIALLVIMIWKGKLFTNYSSSLKRFLISFLLCVVIISVIPFRSIVLGLPDKYATFSMLDANITTYNLSPIGYHIMNAYKYFTEDAFKTLTVNEQEKIKKWYADNNKQQLPDNKYKGLMEGKNLIILQLESMESFPINKTIEGQEITPNINKLLNNSISFTNILEQVNLGTTSDAELMLNTSIYPMRDGSVFFRYPYNKYASLPKLLEEKGYSTVSVHPDKGSYWNWMIAHSNIGFSHSFDSSSFEHDESIGMGISDGTFLRQLVEKLKVEKQPFYNFSITLSNHSPFDLPQEYRELKLSSEMDKSVVGGYLQGVRYVDTQIEKFINGLRAANMLDNTVIVLVGDHEGIHKYYQGEVEAMDNIPDWIKDNGKKVPFIIYNPSLKKAEISNIGGQVDVMPTLLYLMGVDEDKYTNSAMGINLLKTDKNYAVLRDGKVVGKPTDAEVVHATDALEISDLIIKSNYFERYSTQN